MAYRNGTYVAFHAEGNSDPTASDIRYYRMLTAWDANKKFDFRYINSHEKTSAVRDSSKKETLMKSLRERINNSKNFLLIIGSKTKNDIDWVPFEIAHAVDQCALPVIAVYPGYDRIFAPSKLRSLWPAALAKRIDDGTAHAIHIPFKQALISEAIQQFDFLNMPSSPLTYYIPAVYERLGL